jgi:hypothetical protein
VRFGFWGIISAVLGPSVALQGRGSSLFGCWLTFDYGPSMLLPIKQALTRSPVRFWIPDVYIRPILSKLNVPDVIRNS